MDATSGKSRLSLLPVIVLTAALALASCARQTPSGQAPEPGDEAVAKVDGQTVWASDVRREAATQGLIRQGDPLDASTDVFHRVLDEVIDQKLLAAQAMKQHLENDPVAKQRLQAARERILADMLVERLVEKAVSESSIQNLYDEQVQLSKQTDEFHARQIVVASPQDADAVKKQLAAGTAFDSLAMARSIDSDTRYNGGDLGYFTVDVMPPAYAAALKDAKPGDLIGPFKSDAGWVILKVEDRRSEPPISLAAARPQIVSFLTDEQVADLLRRLRGKSQIKMLIPPANPNAPGALPEPASAPPASLEAPATTAPLSAAPAQSAAPPPTPSSVILHMAPGAEPALPHLRSPPPASGPPGVKIIASPAKPTPAAPGPKAAPPKPKPPPPPSPARPVRHPAPRPHAVIQPAPSAESPPSGPPLNAAPFGSGAPANP